MLLQVVRRHARSPRAVSSPIRFLRGVQVHASACVHEQDSQEGNDASPSLNTQELVVSEANRIQKPTKLKHKTALTSKLHHQRTRFSANDAHTTPTSHSNGSTMQNNMEKDSPIKYSKDSKALDAGVLDSVKKDVEALVKTIESDFDQRTKDDRLTPYQRLKGMQKAATGALDKLLWSYRLRGEYDRMEAVAFLWEDVAPHFGQNRKHRVVICSHYAFALNKQQRFQELVDKLFRSQFVGDQIPSDSAIMSYQLAEAVLLACSHLRNATTALQVLRVVEENEIPITMPAYFHLLSALIHDNRFTDVDLMLQICHDIVHKHHKSVPASLLPSIIRDVAIHHHQSSPDSMERIMQLFELPTSTSLGSFTEFRYEICLLALWERGFTAEMLQILSALLRSSCASVGFKARVAKCLLLKSLSAASPSMATTTAILAEMNVHGIRAHYKSVRLLTPALLQSELVQSADALVAFYQQYPQVLDINTCTISDAVVASVRLRNPELVDEFIVYALDHQLPLRYTVLESVIAFYYKLGLMHSYEKVADIVHAMRMNKHIPLGIAVTEIGMIVNLHLRRYEEVIHLFEDFAKLDHEKQRITERRIMLKSALTAYAALNRSDEANAMRTLLQDSFKV